MNNQTGTIDFSVFEQVDIRVGRISSLEIAEGCEPRQVGKHISEVLVLGVPTKDKGTALVVPEMEATIGGRLF